LAKIEPKKEKKTFCLFWTCARAMEKCGHDEYIVAKEEMTLEEAHKKYPDCSFCGDWVLGSELHEEWLKMSSECENLRDGPASIPASLPNCKITKKACRYEDCSKISSIIKFEGGTKMDCDCPKCGTRCVHTKTTLECPKCGYVVARDDGEPYMGVPFHWKTRVSIECKVKPDGPHKIADCQNCQTASNCNYARHVKLAGIIDKMNHEDQVKHPDKVERKTMKVKGGEAWVEHRIFASTREVATRFLAKCSDGIIREVVRFGKLNGTTTGDCPECHQMPCPHTAKLLGWKDEKQKKGDKNAHGK